MTIPTTMRAAVYDRYGPPEVLRVAEVPVPSPKPGEVLIKVAVASVNGGELPGRRGQLSLVLGKDFPKRTGIDLVGTVVAVGAEVTDLHAGQRVWAVSENPIGTAAEYFAVRRGRVSLAPSNLSDADAVTLIAGGTTSLTALRDKVGLRTGERLLVRGAAGGVGSLAVQLGKHFGAHVTALARPESMDFVRGLGADEVIDYRATPLAQLGTYDVIVDSVGSQLPALRRLLS